MSGDTPNYGTHDTFPKLLVENARTRGDKSASREKDYGIWLSWTWGQVADEIRAMACGLAVLGVKHGDKVVICGDNRPHLYWSMTSRRWPDGWINGLRATKSLSARRAC